MLLKGLFLLAILSCAAFAQELVDGRDETAFFFGDSPASRIVGGSPAPLGSAPHMVALTNGFLVRSFFCGGSILSSRTILSAAHCIVAVRPNGVLSSSVMASTGSLRYDRGGISYHLSSEHIHPEYSSATIKNDIGVLYTSVDIMFEPRVATISPSYDYVPGGVAVRATGWGRLIAGGALPVELQELHMQTVDGQECVTAAEEASIRLNMTVPAVDPVLELCTYHSFGHGVCNGDSGSALVRTDTGAQIAIVSWGFPCALDAPDMFVRLSSYQTYLQQQLI